MNEQELFKEHFIYKDYNKGSLFRRKNGKPSGASLCSGGYKMTSINRKLYRWHYVIWVMHFGEVPEGFNVDHIDGDRTNNRINNLRVVPENINKANRKEVGFYKCKQTGRWAAKTELNGIRYWLGRHETEELARQAVIDFKTANGVYV